MLSNSHENWGSVAKTLHLVLAVTLALLLIVHVAAALRHHYVKRDRVLMRMLPSWRSHS